jgi:catechol 2,3-dioxygenase-like lactoylglutathione lyase family enzyme
MKIHRIDHVGIVVNDLAAAKDFFLDLGLEVQGEMEVIGGWVGRLIGLSDVSGTLVMLKVPDGEATLELFKFHTPPDEKGIQQYSVNTLGIRHIAFTVDDIEIIVTKLKNRGAKFFGEIQKYENAYKLCYVHGPEGIIVELAEEIK